MPDIRHILRAHVNERPSDLSISTTPLELWGGVECTINRVGDRFFDQMARSGHLRRPKDLELFASLGIRKLRYGLQWERYCHDGSWQWFDESLCAMQHAGIHPIAGLVHHGSGPQGTSLLDPDFGEKLAVFAGSLAARYPWITSYTPVNEPNTTARFSALYGHWYPHHAARASFVRALLNQLRGSVLAMRSIRQVQPDAQFIHTEDGGKTWSTPEMQEECEFREQRRWLGTDLLCGMVDRHHPMLGFLLRHGATEREILWFADNPCPPDVFGLNYYVTSDRFLDDRTGVYPHWMAGGDTGSQPFVDVEAVRVRQEGIAGVETILREAWERYHLPVAITEAHLGGEPLEQVRWLAEVWKGAQAARAAGIDCRAVTAWAMLGSFDWCHLVTCDRGSYEPGVFDVQHGAPQPTELAKVVGQLTRGKSPHHPALRRPGWWLRPDRLLYAADDPVEVLAA